MKWLSKYKFTITIIGSQKGYIDIGQNFNFKLFSEKNPNSISLKKVHDILQYCLKELFNFNENPTKDFIEIKDFATIPPSWPFPTSLVNVDVRAVLRLWRENNAKVQDFINAATKKWERLFASAIRSLTPPAIRLTTSHPPHSPPP